MIGSNHGCGSFIDSPPGVLPSQNSFDNQRASPKIVDPPHVFPCDSRASQSCVDVDERHRPLPRYDNVRQWPQTTIPQETASHPGWANTSGRNRILSRSPPLISSLIPLRMSRSRIPDNAVSIVTTTAEKP